MNHVLFAALVSYVASDGLFIDEGAADGVRPGDVVVVLGERLIVLDTTEHSARTGPPAHPFAVKPGTPAEVRSSGEAASAPPPTKAPSPRPPAVSDAEAARWWTHAEDGWAEPRPWKRPSSTDSGGGETQTVFRGDLGLRGTALADHGAGGETVGWTTLYSRLDLERGGWWYGHDLRFNYDAHDGRSSYRPFEAWRAETGWRGHGWGVRGGRMALADPLAGGAVDGAAVDLGPTRIFGGVAPDMRSLEPSADAPLVGASAGGALQSDGGRLRGDVWALASGYRGRLDRTAVAPQLRLVSDPVVATALAELDAYPDHNPLGRPAVDLTRLYLSTLVRPLTWLDASARYALRRDAVTRELQATGLPLTADLHHDLWLDARLDGGGLGTLVPSLGLLWDPAGQTTVPGLDYWVALARWLDGHASWFERRGPEVIVDQGRGGVTFRLDRPWLAELDAAARVDLIRLPERGEEQVEPTVELGAWVRFPAGTSLRVSAEHSRADRPRTLAFADLRWRFGP